MAQMGSWIRRIRGPEGGRVLTRTGAPHLRVFVDEDTLEKLPGQNFLRGGETQRPRRHKGIPHNVNGGAGEFAGRVVIFAAAGEELSFEDGVSMAGDPKRYG